MLCWQMLVLKGKKGGERKEKKSWFGDGDPCHNLSACW
jgi:hypothetical protein